MTVPTTGPAKLACPNCGAEVTPTDSYCEACGSELTPTAMEAPQPTELEAPITVTRSAQTEQPAAAEFCAGPCRNCGGVVAVDGYCETCGTKATRLRDHFSEQPAAWVGAVCDRGIRHDRNEDAVAIAAEPAPNSRAVLVVCDGVSTSEDSDVASLAGARAAREVLVTHTSGGMGTQSSRIGALSNALVAAAAAANTAVIENTSPESDNAASCTFAAAVLEGDLIVFGNVGDSRVYWLPDAGEALELGVDDSVAQFRIESGMSRSEAEAAPQAHAITKWLGRDSHDFSPRTGSITAVEPGWLLVCSDGLWNYASEAAALQTLVAELSAPLPRTARAAEPLALAGALVDWANAQGGKDNITTALARFEPEPRAAGPGTLPNLNAETPITPTRTEES